MIARCSDTVRTLFSLGLEESNHRSRFISLQVNYMSSFESIAVVLLSESLSSRVLIEVHKSTLGSVWLQLNSEPHFGLAFSTTTPTSASERNNHRCIHVLVNVRWHKK
jgi:hypothetical protein